MTTKQNNLRRGPGHYQTRSSTRVMKNDDGELQENAVHSRSSSRDSRTYSEVVGAGSVSQPQERRETDSDPNNGQSQSDDTVNGIGQRQNQGNGSDSERQMWVKVQPRRRNRARSLDSAQVETNKFNLHSASFAVTGRSKPTVLTAEQGVTIRAAENLLSQGQRKLIQKRMSIVNETPARSDSSEESDASHGEGPSNGKGKTIDPRNWGAVGLGPEEINIEAQKNAYDNFRALKDARVSQPINHNLGSENESSQPRSKKSKPKKQKICSTQRAGSEALTDQMDNHIRDLVEQRPRGKPKQVVKRAFVGQAEHITRPSELIAPTNHLAKLLTSSNSKSRAVNKRTAIIAGKSNGPPNNPSSSSSSSLSSSSSESSDSESKTRSSSDSLSTDSSNRHQKRRRNKHSKHHSKRSKKMLLKPDPPENYNGSIDVRKYIKFVTEGTAYVRDGHVPKNRRVLKLSKFLQG
ncbi:hypothetical protein GGU11DRAFT_812520 [Lentinula aff. detonsa]|nr:hypothetical protein GGU11DRAFT_812520 [Lentinula aff. detonsa]